MGALAGGVTKRSGSESSSPAFKALVPCTAAGILELLDHYNIPISGKQVVIVGRSPIVGMPAQVRVATTLAPAICLHCTFLLLQLFSVILLLHCRACATCAIATAAVHGATRDGERL